jgi:integrase
VEGRVEHVYHRDERLPVWRGWHAFRRGLATNLHELGVDDKTIQAILRHSSVEVTRKCYIKTLPKQTTDAMEQLNAHLTSILTSTPVPSGLQ